MDDVDTGEIDLLAGYLEREARVMPDAAAKIVKRGATNVKRDARTNASGHARAPRLPYSIDYDLEDGGLQAVIGPDKDKGSGALGTFYEYGSANDAPQPFLAPALDEEEPRFVEALSAAMMDEKRERWWRS